MSQIELKFSLICPVFYKKWAPWFVYQVKKITQDLVIPFEVLIGTHHPKKVYKGIPNMVYVNCPKDMTIGKKRNLLSEKATGQVLISVDDDDWYPRWRLACQWKIMKEQKVDCVTCSSFICYDLMRKEWHRWGAFSESCLMYTKDRWERNEKFDEVSMREGQGIIRNKEPIYDCRNTIIVVAFTHQKGKRKKNHNMTRKAQKIPIPEVIKDFSYFDEWEREFLQNNFNVPINEQLR